MTPNDRRNDINPDKDLPEAQFITYLEDNTWPLGGVFDIELSDKYLVSTGGKE